MMRPRIDKLLEAFMLLIMFILIGLIVHPIFPTGAQLRHLIFGCPRSSSRTRACIENLRRIDEAKRQYVAEHGEPAGGILKKSDIALYIKAIDICFCPSAPGPNRKFDLNYRINPVGKDPECMIDPARHSLADPRNESIGGSTSDKSTQ